VGCRRHRDAALEALLSFLESRVKTDPLWARLMVVLNPHTTPGEAEHKIFDFVRSQRRRGRWCDSTNISCTSLIPTHFFLPCKTTSIVAAS
jgi:5'-3' exonuclease